MRNEQRVSLGPFLEGQMIHACSAELLVTPESAGTQARSTSNRTNVANVATPHQEHSPVVWCFMDVIPLSLATKV